MFKNFKADVKMIYKQVGIRAQECWTAQKPPCIKCKYCALGKLGGHGHFL